MAVLTAFRHHAWATKGFIDACSGLTAAQLDEPIAAIYGSVLDTLRHIVGADTWYLWVVSDGHQGRGRQDDAALSFTDVRDLAVENAEGWERLLKQVDLTDEDRDVVATRLDGTERHATLGVRLAQALHHGSDHRSQVATALTHLGIEPPDLDVWSWGEAHGKSRSTPT